MSTENNSASQFSLKSILEKDKLNYSNFMDWHDNLKIVLKAENKLYVLETPVSTRVLKMNAYVDHLARLESPLSDELVGDIILNSLPKSYDQFIMNYNMNGMEKTLAELHQMLKSAEVNIPSKTAPVLVIKEGQVKKPNTKKMGNQGKGKSVANKKPRKDAKCFHSDDTRHWKRNCAKYLAELKQAKASGGESSGIYVIEIFAFP